jgi:hypothetical protein
LRTSPGSMGRSTIQRFLSLADSNGELLIPSIVLPAETMVFFTPCSLPITSADLHAGVCWFSPRGTMWTISQCTWMLLTQPTSRMVGAAMLSLVLLL